ncbi:MAG: LysM peptidoglycan-binding domain-containing protein [Myxococcota bacterium]|nr:LysM peptidoglycan-binding domain-containing protein [Myxococcota bacterium]
MSRLTSSSFSVVIGFAAGLAQGPALAQDETPQPGQAEGQPYQESLQPGLRISASGSASQSGSAGGGARRRQSIDLTSGENVSEPPPSDFSKIYTVKAGDTLWIICERQYGSAYAWPMVWSYNPEISNPHWIYPGQVLYLTPTRSSLDGVSPPLASAGKPTGKSLVSMSVQRGPTSVSLRNRGFVDTEMLARSGQVVGARSPRKMLGQYDSMYIEFKEGVKPAPGDEYSLYQILRDVEPVDDRDTELGKLVEILGEAKVVSYDPKTRIATAHVDEVTTSFERGVLIGPVRRSFEVVAPVPNEKNLNGRIVAFMDDGVLAGSEQIVFVDRGKADGVRQGNRFLAVEKRDKLRESEDKDDDREGYPTEVVAELRVIEARPHTSTCVVLGAVRELEVGEKVELRRGF